jgi:hypothetical protein
MSTMANAVFWRRETWYRILNAVQRMVMVPADDEAMNWRSGRHR